MEALTHLCAALVSAVHVRHTSQDSVVQRNTLLHDTYIVTCVQVITSHGAFCKHHQESVSAFMESLQHYRQIVKEAVCRLGYANLTWRQGIP